MEHFFVTVFLVLLPLVKPNICPDGSICPGVDPCCASSHGYMCCPLAGGYCCSSGLYCCEPGLICLPGTHTCVSPSSKNNQRNIEVKLGTETKKAKLSQCPMGTTECAETVLGDECCPLPNAVCCSDGLHCCPNGYTCDLPEGLCIQNSVRYRIQKAEVLVKKVQNTVCPDGSECPEDNTCCSVGGGEYGCCIFPQAVCCSDQIHCCPNDTTCDLESGTCISKGNNFVPLVKKKPAIKANRP